MKFIYVKTFDETDVYINVDNIIALSEIRNTSCELMGHTIVTTAGNFPVEDDLQTLLNKIDQAPDRSR